jgi:4-amino-4-deoxy-L-arabinose transferase-like glycosyltransferase
MLTPIQQQSRADRRLRWQIFAAAFAVRVLYILLAHTFKVRPSDDHFEFGWEMGRIGRALATGYGYSDPFTGHTGPTAWTPPLYTLLIGGVFKLFGVYSRMSAFVLLTVNSLLSAWTAVLLWEIGLRCCSRHVALWSGWLWALYPAAMQYSVRWIWEMSATAAVFTAILLLTLRMRGVGEPRTKALTPAIAPDEASLANPHEASVANESLSEGHGFSHAISTLQMNAALAAEVRSRSAQPWQQWAAFGLLWGVLALLNPTPLLMLPVTAFYALLAPGWTKVRLQHASLATLMFLLVLAPWTARNYTVFHRFIPLRDNFGAENFEGNSSWSTGFPWGRTVPLENHRVLAQYAAMGEPAWVADRGARATAWIKAHPKQFTNLTIKRAWMFWAGVPKSVEEAGMLEYGRLMSFQFLSLAGILGAALAIKRRLPGWPLFAGTMLLLPLPYYAVTVQARFRHVLEPVICVMAVYLFQSATRRRISRV